MDAAAEPVQWAGHHRGRYTFTRTLTPEESGLIAALKDDFLPLAGFYPEPMTHKIRVREMRRLLKLASEHIIEAKEMRVGGSSGAQPTMCFRRKQVA